MASLAIQRNRVNNSTLLKSIKMIVLTSAQKQMFWVHALPVIALVTNKHGAIDDLSIKHDPNSPMRSHGSFTKPRIAADLTVAVLIDPPTPIKTAVFFKFYFFKESNLVF
jgi:hypothetical protein